MRLMILVAAIGVSFPGIGSGNEGWPINTKGHTSSWVAGEISRIRIVTTKEQEYDGADGAARLEVWSLDGGKKIKEIPLKTGLWMCLSYSKPAKAFVLGGIIQKGYTTPVEKLKYLTEGSWHLRDSLNSSLWGDAGAGTRKDNNLAVLSSRASSDGRYVAFVGTIGEESGKLMVLDSVTDKLKVLADPPAPPPLSAVGVEKDAHFNWHGGGPADGYLELDEGIVWFPSPHTLKASYGLDTIKARAKQRQEKEWDLRKVFGS